MNRLESINKKLSSQLNNISDDSILKRIYQHTLDFANKEGDLSSDTSIEDIILSLKNDRDLSKDQKDYIEPLEEKHDQIYFDLEDEGKEDEATQEFVKARAFAAV